MILALAAGPVRAEVLAATTAISSRSSDRPRERDYRSFRVTGDWDDDRYALQGSFEQAYADVSGLARAAAASATGRIDQGSLSVGGRYGSEYRLFPTSAFFLDARAGGPRSLRHWVARIDHEVYASAEFGSSQYRFYRLGWEGAPARDFTVLVLGGPAFHDPPERTPTRPGTNVSAFGTLAIGSSDSVGGGVILSCIGHGVSCGSTTDRYFETQLVVAHQLHRAARLQALASQATEWSPGARHGSNLLRLELRMAVSQ